MTDAEIEAPLYTTEEEAIAFAERTMTLRFRSKLFEGCAELVKCEEVLAFARARADLQGSQFLTSCEEWYTEKRWLSKNQVAALMPIAADQDRKKQEIGELIAEVVERHPRDRFVLSLKSFFEQKGYLSKKQLTCLQEIDRKDKAPKTEDLYEDADYGTPMTLQDFH